ANDQIISVAALNVFKPGRDEIIFPGSAVVLWIEQRDAQRLSSAAVIDGIEPAVAGHHGVGAAAAIHVIGSGAADKTIISRFPKKLASIVVGEKRVVPRPA